MAVSSGVGRIAIDNVTELERVQKEAASQGVVQKVFLRLTPGIDPHTHEYLSTGVIDSKFGIPMHSGQHLDAVRLTLASPNLSFDGGCTATSDPRYSTTLLSSWRRTLWWISPLRSAINWAMSSRSWTWAAA